MPTENTQNQTSEDDGPEVQDPGRTEFANIAENIIAVSENLKKMPNLNPQTLRMHLINDLYPLLEDWAQACNWYTGDLHARVSEVEEEVGEGSNEGLDPEFAAELIEFIGVSLQLFGVLVNVCRNDTDVITKVQLLIAKAPGLITKIRDITLEDEEDEEEDEEGSDADVLEPKPRPRVRPVVSTVTAAPEPVPAEPVQDSPTAEPVVASVDTVSADVVQVSTTNDQNPDVVTPSTTVTGGETNG